MKTYTIKKGNHSSNGLNFDLTFNNSVKYRFKFDESCLYKFNDNVSDRFDVNKLFGFSTTWNHHKQSARIGWRCLDGKTIELFPYVYVGGKLQLQYLKKPILNILPDKTYFCDIKDCETHYSFNITDNDIKRGINIPKEKDWFFFHYYLFPYFGGDLTAPHDMKIYIDKS